MMAVENNADVNSAYEPALFKRRQFHFHFLGHTHYTSVRHFLSLNTVTGTVIVKTNTKGIMHQLTLAGQLVILLIWYSYSLKVYLTSNAAKQMARMNKRKCLHTQTPTHPSTHPEREWHK